ncbi:hypothetical protein [Halostreptopolyspora alba]|uniref:hypothetical protein n=1 Tax=Halostreptopolyspora alba TaxID=2487137 RepID=UPI00372283C8
MANRDSTPGPDTTGQLHHPRRLVAVGGRAPRDAVTVGAPRIGSSRVFTTLRVARR